MLDDLIVDYVIDSENPIKNYKVALEYERIGQTAAAISFFLRAAERTEDNELAYECLIRIGHCFDRQKNRNYTVKSMYNAAISMFPERPEAYYHLSRILESEKSYFEAYTAIEIALNLSSKNQWNNLNVGYGGYCYLLFQKAVNGWWRGRCIEARAIFNDLLNNYWTQLDDHHKAMVKSNISSLSSSAYGKDFDMVKQKMSDKPNKKKIVDYCTFFEPTGKEMLQLRISILNDYVDEFIVVESNKTQSGISIEYKLETVIDDLKLPKEKIRIIKLDIPDAEDLVIEEIDRVNCYENNSTNINSLRARVRDRMQKNALLSVLDDYDEDTVFIISDIDEIINPKNIGFMSDIVKQNLNCVIRVPIVHLEGRADLRVYMRDTGQPKEWTGMIMTTPVQLKKSTPNQIRSGVYCNLPIEFVADSGKRMEDLGWHFSWMGGKDIAKLKSKIFTHYDDKFSYLVTDSYTSMDKFLDNMNVEENAISLSGDKNTVLKAYPKENLPKEVFELPNVEKFLFPKKDNSKLNNLPTIHYISLEESVDRRKNLENWFNSHKITNYVPHIFKRFEKYNHTVVGNLVDRLAEEGKGSITSHLSLLKKLYDNYNDEYFFVTEDDISLEPIQHWNFTWTEFVDSLPTDWNCVQLSVIREYHCDQFYFTHRKSHDWLAASYLIKREHIKYLLDKHYNSDIFTLNLDYDIIPVVEHILFPCNIEGIYTFPLFVEDCYNSNSTSKELLKQRKGQGNHHYESHNAVMRWWENIGKDLTIQQIMKGETRHIYEEPQFGENWFSYPNLYTQMVAKFPSGSKFVEIGSWKGKSSAFMTVLIANSYKKIDFHCVDTWQGSIEHHGREGLDRLYDIFTDNMKPVKDYYTAIRTPSLDGANRFEDNSLDFVFIDASHEYEDVKKDIAAWLPKVKIGGVIAGHDYYLGDTDYFPGVKQAVHESFDINDLTFQEDCWIHEVKERKIVGTFSINSRACQTSWVVDSFYSDPDKVRKFALGQEYLEGGLGKGFIGRRTHKQFLFPELKDKFQDIMGKKITNWEEHGMNGRFQVAWSGEPLVYHCDSQKWGGMLYLTPGAPYQCGTTLYANKQTRARTYYDQGWNAAWVNVPGDCHLDGTPFEPVDVLGNVYNRLVIFDASCIHSASQYFGTNANNSRLWQMFFFDTE